MIKKDFKKSKRLTKKMIGNAVSHSSIFSRKIIFDHGFRKNLYSKTKQKIHHSAKTILDQTFEEEGRNIAHKPITLGIWFSIGLVGVFLLLQHKYLDHLDEATIKAALGRASLSGVQRKLLLVKDGKEFRPVKSKELSTRIAKLPSGDLKNLVELEFLTTLAVKNLLPRDEVVDLKIAETLLRIEK
jgi:hypothetical protein